jgi:hypothetical protein
MQVYVQRMRSALGEARSFLGTCSACAKNKLARWVGRRWHIGTLPVLVSMEGATPHYLARLSSMVIIVLLDTLSMVT